MKHLAPVFVLVMLVMLVMLVGSPAAGQGLNSLPVVAPGQRLVVFEGFYRPT